MSRLETGVIQIQKKNCDLAETLKKAVSAVVAAASSKQIRILAEAEGPFFLPHDPSGRKRRSLIFWTMQSSIQNLAAGSGLP